MIQIEKLSYGVPAKELYDEVSFSIEMGQHCVLIGSNGTGKSTLADMIINSEEYLYDGKIIKDEKCRIGYASQFSVRDKSQDCTVFEYLSQRFLDLENEIAQACEEMAVAEDMEAAFDKYQALLDLNEAMDADNYESNIHKQLHIAGMKELENTKVSQISGGEYKLLQIVREMLLAPNVLVLDEPDVFLDFANLNSLRQLINGYKGALLVITHNRYLLNHCFNKILNLENKEIEEFNGNYGEYRCKLLREKLELKMQYVEEEEEIERTQEMVDILRRRATIMVNPVIGRSVNAKQSQLDRLKDRHINSPFIELREPEIILPEVEPTVEIDPETGDVIVPEEKRDIITIADYKVAFDKELLENVNFQLKEGEKVAIVGANGTGKTTLIKDILKNEHPAIKINEDVKYACLSQLQGIETDDQRTVYQVMQDVGFGDRTSIKDHLKKYCMDEEYIDQKFASLSGGEQNLLQIAMLAISDAELLILDEPTSHLDIFAQLALERALIEYKGTVLMVSHDFYLVANCADYVLLVDENTVRRVKSRKFRKMVYDKYFDQKYLEVDKKKQEVEEAITLAFKKNDFVAVDKLCTQLEELSVN